MIMKAAKERTVDSTLLNQSSSRSHMLVLADLVVQRSDATIVKSRVTFGDLAGSEKLRKTEATGTSLS